MVGLWWVVRTQMFVKWTVPGSRCDLRQWQPEARSDPVCWRVYAANLSRTTAQRECGCARLPRVVSRDGCLAWLCVAGFFWGGLLAGRCWLNAASCLLKVTNWLAHVHTWNLVSSNAGWANEFKRARFRKYCRVLVQGSGGKV